MNNPFEHISEQLHNIELSLNRLLQQLDSPAATYEVGGLELAQEITRLSKPRIYALVSARGIPHAKRGNKLYFNRSELLSWVAAGSRGQKNGHDKI